ncbi:MAG: N-ethylammeline chlorohydrolase [Porticoccaceae bacterium]|nr:MAG: N-ethylammeline chlorohydrolase [Porticoccaceae bacterium]
MEREAADWCIAARWVIPVEPAQAVYEDCAVVVRDGRILALCPASEVDRRFRCAQRVELSHHLVTPGLVNAHGHAAMTLLRGVADDLDLDTWLRRHIWPLEARFVDADFVRDGTRLAAAEMIRGGTTCFADQYFFPEEVAAVAREAGLRAQVGFPVIEVATAWARDGEACLHRGLELHDALRGDPLLSVAFAPHAVHTVAEPLLERIAVLAAEVDGRIHIHLHETAAEVAAWERRRGERPLATLDRLGLLGETTQCVHMVALDEADLELLAERRPGVVHCPRSNLKLGSGICPLLSLLERNLAVGLGTDGAASNNSLDLLAEMQLAALLAKGTSGDAAALDAHRALRLATLDGARVLGLAEETGSLEPGKSADLAAFDLSGLAQQPLHHPLSALAYTTTASSRASHVWVAGRALLVDGALTTLDEGEIAASARFWRRRLATAEAEW